MMEQLTLPGLDEAAPFDSAQGAKVAGRPRWPMVKLGDILDVRDGTHDSPTYVSEGFPLVTSKNIVNGQLDLSVVSYISENDYNQINMRSKVEKGDIIMPMIGTIGNPLLIIEEPFFAIKNVALFKFNSQSKFLNTFVYYALKSPIFDSFVIQLEFSRKRFSSTQIV
jgi:type I restriction enzyme S subunit